MTTYLIFYTRCGHVLKTETRTNPEIPQLYPYTTANNGFCPDCREKEYKYSNEHICITINAERFSIDDLHDQYNLPCMIQKTRSVRKCAKLKKWCKENLPNENITFNDMAKILEELKIKSHYYCRMD